MNQKALLPQTRLASPTKSYTIMSVLGQGGFGITYLASTSVTVDNMRMPAMVAIKEHFPAEDCTRGADGVAVEYSGAGAERFAESMKDFLLEARCLQRLAGLHPSIVPVSEVFRANDTAYYVMQYIDGQTLKQYVEARGALSWDETCAIMTPIIEAVAALHANRFTHLDIKPGNIMLTTDEATRGLQPMLIDFGLAKHYNTDGSSTVTLRASGFSEGYAPVEQYAGISRFSPAVDVYSLGATMLFCLTGKKPLPATEITTESLSRAIPAYVPAHGRDIIIRAMSYQASDRFADAGAMLAALSPTAAGGSDDDHTRRVILPPTPPVVPPTVVRPDESASRPQPHDLTPEKNEGSSGLIKALSVTTLIFLIGLVCYAGWETYNASHKTNSSGVPYEAPEYREIPSEYYETPEAPSEDSQTTSDINYADSAVAETTVPAEETYDIADTIVDVTDTTAI